MGNIKWGRVVVWAIIGALIMIVVPILYVTVRMVALGFQMGGNPGPEAQKAFSSGPVMLAVVFLGGAVGGFLGGRGPARKAEGSYLLNGILAGVLIAILYLIWSLIGSGFGLLLLALAAVVIAFSALGGWVGGRGAQAEEYD